MLVGMVRASDLSDRVGIVPMIIADGICNFLAALLTIVLLAPALRAKATANAAGEPDDLTTDGAALSRESPTA